MNLIYIFVITFLIQFIIGLEASFVSPIIPYLANYFSIKESSVIYLNTGFSLIGLMAPLFGMMADKYGKKRAILYALIFFFIGTLVTGWSPSPFVFALGRMLIGVGNITLGASLVAYISDYVPYHQRGRGAGILRISFAISILISPIYSSNMVKYLNIHYLYWSVSILVLLVLFMSLRLPEKKADDHDDLSNLNLKEVFSIIKNPITIEFLAAQFLLVISPIVMFSYLSIWLKNTFSLSQDHIGYIFMLTAIGTVVGVLLSTALSDRIGKMQFTKLSFVLMTLALAPLPYVKSIYLVIPLALIYAIGLDGGWSAFQTVCSEIYPKRRTVFMTLLFFMNSICSLIFTLIGPTLFDFGGYKLVIWIGTITSLLSLILFFHISSNKEVKKKLGL